MFTNHVGPLKGEEGLFSPSMEDIAYSALKPVDTTLEELKLVLELFSNHHTTITGDLNIDYLQSELSIIKNYKEFLDEYFFHQSEKIATRITNKFRTLIDHSVTNIPHSMEANVLIHAIADHQTVFSSIYPKRENTKKEIPIHSTRTLLKESIESIKNNIDWLAQIATLNFLDTNPEEVCNNFNDYFINLASELASQIQPPNIPMEDLLINAPKPNKKFTLKPITLEDVKKSFQP